MLVSVANSPPVVPLQKAIGNASSRPAPPAGVISVDRPMSWASSHPVSTVQAPDWTVADVPWPVSPLRPSVPVPGQ